VKKIKIVYNPASKNPQANLNYSIYECTAGLHRKVRGARHLWLTPVILVTREAETWRITV
jgi:hypothetical protein